MLKCSFAEIEMRFGRENFSKWCKIAIVVGGGKGGNNGCV